MTKASSRPNIRPPTPRRTPRRPLVIGLVGGVASGKSTVAALFAEHGARVIDADRIAHEALDLPEVRRAIRAAWGDAVFHADGRPDRARIAERVFSDPAQLRLLTRWVHPPTRARMRQELDAFRRDPDVALVVLDAPLLLEAGLDAWCDALVFVQATPERRADRARTARGWAADEVARREAQQSAPDFKRAQARYRIDNDGSLEATRAAVAALYKALTIPPGSGGPFPVSEGE